MTFLYLLLELMLGDMIDIILYVFV